MRSFFSSNDASRPAAHRAHARLRRCTRVMRRWPAVFWGLLIAPTFLPARPVAAGALVDLPTNVVTVAAAPAGGQWLVLRTPALFSRHDFLVGSVPNVTAYLANSRLESSCWMEPCTGRSLSGSPAETQFLLVRQGADQYLAMVPLLDGAFRCSLQGDGTGQMWGRAESGDSNTTTNCLTALYLETRRDPYALEHSAAVQNWQKCHPGQALTAPQMPEFAHYFGWCSWNAFYGRVSQAGIFQAIAGLRAGGAPPGFVVVDNGWFPATNDTFISYHADPKKFPDGLKTTVQSLKADYGVRQVLMWQAYNGYWRGADPAALPGIGIQMLQPSLPSVSPRGSAESSKRFCPSGYYRLVGEPDLDIFYATFHRHLLADGMDGVKVDAMTWIETLGEGRGGRVAVMRELVNVTERSARDLFHGNVIWCSSCSSDCILQAPRSPIMRSSGDFDPGKEVAQGRHVAANAQNSLWMGEFVIPDWDIFQSDRAAGAFHAAARAISGGPVYVADAPGQRGFAVLLKLVLSDGSLPLCLGPGKPAPYSLFADSVHDGWLFKIFNHNPAGGAVIGLLNCTSSNAPDSSLTGVAALADVPDLTGTNFAALSHQSGKLQRLDCADVVPVSLPALGFELVTLAPITDGFAAIGLADKFNSGGCVTAVRQLASQHIEVDLRDGSQFVVWNEYAPRAVTADGRPLTFHYDAAANTLHVTVPRGRPVHLRIEQTGSQTFLL